MAQRMTLTELKGLVATLVDAAVQAGEITTLGTESVSGLINKVMKEVVIDGNFEDKLPELDGDTLEFGKYIEEWYFGLIPAETMPGDGSAELIAKRPDFDEVVYSEKFGKTTFPITVDEEQYQVAVNNAADYERIVNLILTRLYQSLAQFRYGEKKKLIGKMISKAEAYQAGTASDITAYSNNDDRKAGKVYSQSSKYYFALKSGKENKSLATLATEGKVKEITDLVETIAVPVDTSTSEAFLKAVKVALEDSAFVSEGHSLAGTTIGASEGLVCYIKKGIVPTIEVDALAGAINKEYLQPITFKVVEDFGDYSGNAFCVLLDPRGVKLHNNYRSVRDTLVGSEDYRNFWIHNTDTGFCSKHTFVKVFASA